MTSFYLKTYLKAYLQIYSHSEALGLGCRHVNYRGMGGTEFSPDQVAKLQDGSQ